ncbi:hypothetical protein Bca4012_079145 [Brassica carinata]|uniref:(rape) hypothetical protein n=1 Tax=Brassica napus TaxID=3708 RepID=A0A816N246_BRANA|nr:unnamed protein product [Brassica napus]
MKLRQLLAVDLSDYWYRVCSADEFFQFTKLNPKAGSVDGFLKNTRFNNKAAMGIKSYTTIEDKSLNIFRKGWSGSENMYREKGLSMWMLLRLSFQSLGIVYGDLGTSPLYVFYNTFPDGIKDMKLIPNQQRSDEDLTTYSRTLVAEGSFAAKTKKWLESKESRKTALLFVVLLGTCMMIGDGVLTPAISVLSATSGIKVSSPKMSSDIVVVMSIVILTGTEALYTDISYFPLLAIQLHLLCVSLSSSIVLRIS